MKNLMAKISLAMFALGLMVLPNVSKAADFDATDTTGILTTAFANVSPTLKYGIIAVLGIGLGIWAIFFIIGKLKKHTK